MPKHLEYDLGALDRRLLAQMATVEAAVQKSVRSLRERNAGFAHEVIAGASEVARQVVEMESDSVKMLALFQPVAADLRRIVTALKISTNLGRMDDLAGNIAERVLALVELPPVPEPRKLSFMIELTVGMVRQSLDAFLRHDGRLARQVVRLDDEVDRINREIIEELVALMQRDGAAVPAALSLFSAVRCLERIADHAAHIGEDVVYLVEGEIIRSRPDLQSPAA